MRQKNTAVILGMLILIILFPLAKAVCCEKTTEGATCIDMDSKDDCNGNYRTADSSCEATSFCKTGTCVDSSEGTCSSGTPEVICTESGGTWYEEDIESISQCNLGCCYLGDEADLMTQTRCSSLAAYHGLEVDFDKSITDRLECITSFEGSQDEGACVISTEYETTCLRTNLAECYELERSPDSSFLSSLFGSDSEEINNVDFYEGYLCSAEELGADCGPGQKTTCVEGKHQVYFLDTCGNIANIYDSSKYPLNDKEDSDYWTYIYDSEESCNYELSNAGSKTCGNCDYFYGSTCKSYREAGSSFTPKYGEYICADLNCKYEGKTYEHGEKWCGYLSEDGLENSPGSNHYVFSCMSGEIGIETCAVGRQDICVEGETDEGFSYAGCVTNQWQDCYTYTSEENCEEADYCEWEDGIPYLIHEESEKGYCHPEYSPGLDFWIDDSGDEITNAEYCSTGTSICIVRYESGIWKNRDELEDADVEEKLQYCVENCQCLEGYTKSKYDAAQQKISNALRKKKFAKTDEYDIYKTHEDWLLEANNKCIFLGDCGGVEDNYLGVIGYDSNSVNDKMEEYLMEEFTKLTQGGKEKD